ncbi:N-acetylmuramoyl-L-alanine amidase [Butyrivibrio sp. CB08]|uniref:N-acetylmuramoyl-L-alanine amidase family protein n=1 Tax=Butyrivibrio sp. CB08 TaxID=2364879 RepID=UPI000EA9C603|nr:N-acetylmuramoyl-L-alanine amidase [Butyrivibrio sp. CB08]RKM62489.1 N-acetylmuramoyl-L-alanine amidase [Butyrivibrio sp. CB08]
MKKASDLVKRVLTGFIMAALSIALFTAPAFSIKSYAAPKNVVVVIDPGHGGTGDRNLGAQYNGLSEKELTLQLANILKAELEKYEGITVYQTRTTDVLMSLEDRAVFAKNVGADFVFSIHFNASAEHIFYGSEVWTSTFGSFYQKGYNFGQIVLGEWGGLGLYQKGVKTKIGSSGNDYYGIIRQCVARNTPCVILEHAYLDQGNDVSLIKTSDFISKLAQADATAIAKYYGLKSSKTGADYSGYTYKSVKKPSGKLYQDESGPDKCEAKVLTYDTNSGNVLVELTAVDNQSPVIYFSYSYDGGKTFCPLQMWDRTKPTQSFNVKVPSGTVNPNIIVRAYNNYEKGSESAPVAVNAAFNY